MTQVDWHRELGADGILWLNLDKHGSSANTLDRRVLEALSIILEDVATNASVRGVVIRSKKPSGFILGADIEQFKSLGNSDEATRLIQEGQALLDRMEAYSKPIVALIEGSALGGGLELALACRYRIATANPKTRLGLPEVKLGIQPGWGGTIRLPKLIGGPQAMDLILSGRTVDANKAKRLGFVDAAVPERQAQAAAEYYIKNLPPVRSLSSFKQAFDSDFMRPLIGRWIRRKLEQKVRQEHYPAPYAILDLWIDLGPYAPNAMAAEAGSIGRLLVTDVSRNLVRVFFLQEQMKSLGKRAKYRPKHVHVIGGGVMGGDIAIQCALRGLKVTVEDTQAQVLSGMFQRAHQVFKKRLKDKTRVMQARDRLIPDLAGHGRYSADVVIEAVVEKEAVKREIFEQLEGQVKPDAILATNTSTIPLEHIAQGMQQPERLVGIHFFNPVDKMPLVEVVQSEHVRSDIVDKTLAFVRAIDKLPLPVRSAPGFLVNRILMPYMSEAMTLMEEGVSPTAIDEAACAFGMPMGPVELADHVGLDICLASAETLSHHYGGEISDTLRKLVATGCLGKKTASGFYQYKNGKAVKDKVRTSVSPDIAPRLMMRMVNESVACLAESVVDTADLLDAGMIFGAGFPPFRGGPMAYLRTEGESRVREQLNAFASRYGARFAVDETWEKINAA